MSRKSWLLLSVAVLTLVLDQGSKAVVRRWPVGASTEWVPGLFSTVHLHNPGGLLGLAAGWPLSVKLALFLASATGIAVVAWLWLLRLEARAWLAPVGLGALLGGAAGNTLDRILSGGVTDFLVLGSAVVDPWLPWLPWIERTPAFNLADAFLGLGLVLLAASIAHAWWRHRASVGRAV